LYVGLFEFANAYGLHAVVSDDRNVFIVT
jgi:hypothetical protein